MHAKLVVLFCVHATQSLSIKTSETLFLPPLIPLKWPGLRGLVELREGGAAREAGVPLRVTVNSRGHRPVHVTPARIGCPIYRNCFTLRRTWPVLILHVARKQLQESSKPRSRFSLRHGLISQRMLKNLNVMSTGTGRWVRASDSLRLFAAGSNSRRAVT